MLDTAEGGRFDAGMLQGLRLVAAQAYAHYQSSRPSIKKARLQERFFVTHHAK
jgi:hypothetical protein